MKTIFRADARNLAERLKQVLTVVDKRTTIPILSHVRITPHAAGLTLSGTDLDRQVDIDCDADGSGAEAFTVDPRPLSALLAKLPAGTMVVFGRGKDLVVTVSWCGGEARFNTLPACDFPDMYVGEATASAELPAGFNADVLAKVSRFISTEETRYYLNGVCFDVTSGGASIVATDGHRLSAMNSEEVRALGSSKTIVPRAFVTAWSTLHGGLATALSVHGSKHVSVNRAGVRLQGKVIDGSYPDWRRVIPAAGKPLLVARRADLLNALSQLSALKADSLRIATADGETRVDAKVTGEGGISILLPTLEAHNDFAIGFNPRYLSDGLDTVAGKVVTLWGTDAAGPVRVDSDVEGPTIILMPLREPGSAFAPAPTSQPMKKAA